VIAPVEYRFQNVLCVGPSPQTSENERRKALDVRDDSVSIVEDVSSGWGPDEE
jgi:hypothetical protein